MTFPKTRGPNGTAITMVLGKAGSRQGAVRYKTVGVCWRVFVPKGCPIGILLKILEIEDGTNIQLFMNIDTGNLQKPFQEAVSKQYSKYKK